MRKIFVVNFLLLISSGFCWGQSKVEMADALYASGKIYVVIAVIVAIFLGIVAYLFLLERRVKNLEQMSE